MAGSLCYHRVATFVKDIRAKVSTLGPDDRTDLGVNPHLAKESRVLKRLEYTIPRNQGGDVDLPSFPAFERQEEEAITCAFNLDNVFAYSVSASVFASISRTIPDLAPVGHARAGSSGVGAG